MTFHLGILVYNYYCSFYTNINIIIINTKNMMKKMNALDWVAMVLIIVGGLNWGLVGLFEFDLVATIFGDMSMLSRIVYVLVGLSALYMIYGAMKMSNKGSHQSM
jgi:uncharacterized protein